MEHTCARLADGRVACWGSSQSGALGIADQARRGEVNLVTGLDRVEQIAAGARHVCARRAN
jgi:hypothetical protein